MKYESNVLKRLIDTYGVIGNPKYMSEIIKQFIVQGKECFPHLFTYQADWLAHIDEFGLTSDYVVSYTGQQIYAPHSKEKPVKRAILKGNTLVNVAYFKQGLYNYTDYNLLFIDKTKSYFIKFNTTFETTQIGFIVDNNTWNVSKQFNATKNGYVIIKPDEAKDINALRVRFNGNTDKSFIPTLDLICIEYQEGMENWDIPYFEGMQSVKMPVLTTVGKNICPPLEFGNFSNLNGEDWETKDLLRSKVIKVEPLTTYKLSNDLSYSYKTIEMDLNYNVIKYSESSTITTTNNTNYIRVKTAMGQNDINVKFQIEKGSVATSYEPYKTNILSASEDVTLRGIGDVQDTLDCLTGEFVSNFTHTVLKGQDDYSYLFRENFSTGDTYYYEITPTNFVLSGHENIRISDKLPSVDVWGAIENRLNIEGIEIASNNIIIRLLKSKLANNTIEALKTFLSSNPINVIYANKEKPVKTVDLTIKDQNNVDVNCLGSFKGGTHFYTTSQVGSLKPVIEVDVVTELAETLNICSLDGNTM